VSGQTAANSPLDSPELAAAKRLLDTAKESGFAFERTGPGEDAPLLGVRESVEWVEWVEWVDEIVLAGFWEAESCCAVRRRRCSLLVPGGLPVAERVSGGALAVVAHRAVRLGDSVNEQRGVFIGGVRVPRAGGGVRPGRSLRLRAPHRDGRAGHRCGSVSDGNDGPFAGRYNERQAVPIWVIRPGRSIAPNLIRPGVDS
jgi:hypothetical protein